MTGRIGPGVLAICLCAGAAPAGPLEPPPDGFVSPLFVDTAGCAFARVELGGETLWAGLTGREGAPVCGQVPSLAPITRADDLPAIAPNRSGTAPVFPAPGSYAQVGAFTGSKKADAVTAQLQALGLPVLRQDFPRGARPMRVLFVGPFPDEATAARAKAALRRLGYADAFLWTQN